MYYEVFHKGMKLTTIYANSTVVTDDEVQFFFNEHLVVKIDRCIVTSLKYYNQNGEKLSCCPYCGSKMRGV